MASEPSAAGKSMGSAGLPTRKLLGALKSFFVLVVVVFWVIFVQRHWDALSTTDWSLDAPWAAAALLVFALYFLGQATGWVLIARAMGYRLPMAEGSGVWLVSMPARYVPGNIWHIAARISLAARHNVAPEGVVVSSTAEQLLMVLSAACLGLAWVPTWAGANGTLWALAFFAACLAGLQPPVLRLLLRLGSSLLGRAMPAVTLGYRQLATLLVWYTLVNAVNGMAFALLASAAVQPPRAEWPAFASAYCLAYVVGYVSFLTPSGIGVREAALASMLSLYLPVPAAVTLSLLARLISTAGEGAAVLAVGLPLAGGKAGRSQPQKS